MAINHILDTDMDGWWPEPAGSSVSLQETAIGPYPEPTGATLPGRRENISSLITGIEMAVRFMHIKLRKEYERGQYPLMVRSVFKKVKCKTVQRRGTSDTGDYEFDSVILMIFWLLLSQWS
jgi:hypothetical protein